MNIKTLRIVFMGTPEFAVASLERMIREGFNVVAVITAPDRPAGRGKQIRQSDVKKFVLGLNQGIPILQPDNLKHPDFLGELTLLEPDLQVVVAFRMLPESVWGIPRLGTFNLHASLLPQYRGAAPINHAIINGETETGVTTFMIDDKIDTGNILLQQKTAIGEQESAGALHDRLKELGAGLVVETLSGLAGGSLRPQAQERFNPEGRILKSAPKIQKSSCRISWDQQGKQVSDLIRGLSPYPGAFTYLSQPEGEMLLCKIFTSEYEHSENPGPPGTAITDGKHFLKAAVDDGYIRILSLQQEGKRRMAVKDFLAGFSFSSGKYRFS